MFLFFSPLNKCDFLSYQMDAQNSVKLELKNASNVKVKRFQQTIRCQRREIFQIAACWCGKKTARWGYLMLLSCWNLDVGDHPVQNRSAAIWLRRSQQAHSLFDDEDQRPARH